MCDASILLDSTLLNLARLQNFSSVHDVDPSMNTQFAKNLKKKCSKPSKDDNAGEFLDSTSSTFDNDYYKRL